MHIKSLVAAHTDLSIYLVFVFLILPVLLISSCTFSVTPVYNSQVQANTPTNKEQVNDVTNRDDLKTKAIEQVKLFHKQIENGNLDDAYQMIDDGSPLKNPKAGALASMKEVVDTLGKLEKIDLNRDKVVEDKSLNGGQLQVRQEFIVKFEKDTASPTRYELFNWNVYPDGSLKLWSYMNSKGDD